jgi:hypothetical protein
VVQGEAEAWVDHMGMEMDIHMLHMRGVDGMGYELQLREQQQQQIGSGELRSDEDGEGVMQDELQEAQ